MMKATLILIVCFFTGIHLCTAQGKVANYSTGTPGKDTYEHFSFWADDGQPGKVYYTYGADRKELLLKLKPGAGKTFTVIFPNKLELTVAARGNNLLVEGKDGRYQKVFEWEYEGPVDGRGTFCEPCAANEQEAMQLLKTAYFSR